MSKRKNPSKEGFSRQRVEEKVGYLRERADVFWEVGRRLFEEGKFDVAAFNLEQACQLFLKRTEETY